MQHQPELPLAVLDELEVYLDRHRVDECRCALAVATVELVDQQRKILDLHDILALGVNTQKSHFAFRY